VTAGPGDGIEAAVRDSFARQAMMAHLGVVLEYVGDGEVRLGLAYRPELTQQHGYLHAGTTTALVDSACGYAALTRYPPGSDVVSVSFTVNHLAPAVGVRFTGVGRIVRAGRRITVCSGEVHAIDEEGTETLVTLMQATMSKVGGS
jgi:uncharacterized protein (TIGR00369 family)